MGGDGVDTATFQYSKVLTAPDSPASDLPGLTLDLADQRTVEINLENVQAAVAYYGFIELNEDYDFSLREVENIIGTPSDDIITGDANDNVIDGHGGNDYLDGGAGIDTLSFASLPGPVSVDLVNNQSLFARKFSTVDNFENVTGTPGPDTLTGDAGDNTFNFSGGLDVIRGVGGFDTFSYALQSSPVDVDFSSASTPKLIDIERILGTTGDDKIVGGSGDDGIDGNGGKDQLDGGDGTNTLMFLSIDGSVAANLQSGTAASKPGSPETLDYTFSNFQNIRGSAGNDTLAAGTVRNAVIEGGPGADIIQTSGTGAFQTVSYESSAAGVTVNLPKGVGSGGDAEGDQYVNTNVNNTGSNFRNIIGSQENDQLITNGGNMTGLDGSDIFTNAPLVSGSSSVVVAAEIEDFSQEEGDKIDVSLLGISSFDQFSFTGNGGRSWCYRAMEEL